MQREKSGQSRIRTQEVKRKTQKKPQRISGEVNRVHMVFGSTMPKLTVPHTAQLRRQRNKRRLPLPQVSIRDILFSTRWLSLLLLVLSFYAIKIINESDRYYLMSIGVEGENYLTEQEILQVSGLLGSHIFTADIQQAKLALNQLPTVISATVSLDWPNRVMIDIVEDEPIAIWQQGEEMLWINRNGSVIPATVDLPELIHIISEDPAPLEQFTFIATPILEGALQLWQLQPGLEHLYYRPAVGLSFDDKKGWRAYFGVGQDMAQKLVVYQSVTDYLLDDGLTPMYISVSDYKKPFYKAVK